MKRELEHAHFGVRSEVFRSFRSFGNISELPFVRKYYPASVRSNIFSSFRAFKSISELPLVRKYYRTSVRSKVLQGNGKYLGEDEWHHIKSDRLSLLC